MAVQARSCTRVCHCCSWLCWRPCPQVGAGRLRQKVPAHSHLLGRLAIALISAVVLFILTSYLFLSKSGYTWVGYQVSQGERITIGGSAPINLGIIKKGDAKAQELPLANRSLIPMVALFQVVNDPLDEVHPAPEALVLTPRTNATVNVGVDSKEIGEWRPVPLAMTMAPYLLPVSWIAYLARINPMAPNLVISLGLFFLVPA